MDANSGEPWSEMEGAIGAHLQRGIFAGGLLEVRRYDGESGSANPRAIELESPISPPSVRPTG